MAYIYKNTDKISFYCHSNVMNEYKLNYEIYVYGHKKKPPAGGLNNLSFGNYFSVTGGCMIDPHFLQVRLSSSA